MLRAAVEAAEAASIEVAVGPVFTSDLFYGPESDAFATMRTRGILGVEMEIAALYALAAAEGVSAVALLTVSDDIFRGGVMSSEARENTFHDMVRVALALA